jgi:ribosome-associated toxin RatA of RatAB toxin-antitoxin module
MRKFAVITVYFLIAGFIQEKPKETWHLKKFENGISVYTRQAENSRFKELKSDFQIKTSLSSIVALLNDFESYPEWVYRCEKSYTAKKIASHEFIHYQSVKAPWPVDNRDIIIYKKLTQDPVTKVITQHALAMPDYLPRVLKHVRVLLFKAQWTITPLKNGVVNVEYQLLVDPGGNIPAWIVNLAVVDGPYDTELKMKEWLMKEKYQKMPVAGIKEP